MNIAIAQLNYHIGDLEGNSAKIIEHIKKAENDQIDLLIFSELALTGYPPRDMLDYPGFMDRVEAFIEEIKKACSKVSILLGTPTRTNLRNGKALYNSALFISEGEVKHSFHKTLLPTYDIFDEARYFEVNQSFELLEFKGEKLGVLICEDIWNESNHLYQNDPVEEIFKLNPNKLIVLSASPFDYTQSQNRKELLQSIASVHQTPIYYVNQIGSYTDIIFDGRSMVLNASGEIVLEMKGFEEEYFIVESQRSTDKSLVEDKIALIHDALVLGIKDYFQKLGFKKAVVGMSGGIDSAVIGVLAQRALGSENVFFVLMPSKYSSDHSISDAVALSENLGAEYKTIGIQEIVDSFENSLDPLFYGLPIGLAEENIQARARGVLLMAISNKFGHILLNTSNKSEMSVGYSTLYGDMCGGLSALGDVFKQEVYALARYMNKEGEVIPDNIIIKAPSAELRPDQKDSDSLPDYDVLDRILFEYIDERKTKGEIIQLGFDEETVNKIIRLVNISEYKRYQSPPVLKISTKAFGYGRRMPIVAKYE